MRRLLSVPAFLFSLTLAAAGCDGDEPRPLPGFMEQPAAAAIAGDHLYVASPPSDSLRVLSLQDGSADFVRAPNPLFALEVPAVRRPTMIHALPAGEPEGRDLILAFSSVDAQMRVIDAEAMRPLGAPIALPGRPLAVDTTTDGLLMVACVASDEDADPGVLAVVELSAAARERGADIAADASPLAEMDLLPIDALPGGLAVSETAGATSVWISDLENPRVLLLEPESGEADIIDTGEPLGALVASPPVDGPEAQPKGRLVHGLTADGLAMLSLDGESAEVAPAHVFDGEPRPMPLPRRGVTLTSVARVFVDVVEEEEALVTQVPLLVLVATVDGGILYFDGGRMAPIDRYGRGEPEPFATLDPAANVSEEGGYSHDRDFSAPVLETVENPDYESGGAEPPLLPDVAVTPGVSRSRTWSISWRGELSAHSPALGGLERAGEEVSVLPSSPIEVDESSLGEGDLLYIADRAAHERAGCSAFEDRDALVWEVLSIGEEGQSIALRTLEGGAPLPDPACFDEPFVYRLRARAYTVSATGLDEVFRLEPGDVFEYEGRRFMSTSAGGEGPELRFTLAEEQDEQAMEEGATRKLVVHSGIDVLTARPDTSEIPASSIIGRPAVHLTDPGRFGTGRVYVPYAGPGYLISFDLRSRGGQQVHR